jgi:multiple sugar transport system permease protein/sn-glycerol 3-phosphate transport system permease protein
MQEVRTEASLPTLAQARSRNNLQWRSWLAGYLCILPALVIITVFSLFPVFYSLRLSLYRWNFVAPEPEFVGLRNFERLFTSEQFWQVLRNTLFFSVGSVILIVLISLALALVLDVKLRGIAFFRALFFIPHLTPMVAIATLWLFLYDPAAGLINAGLGLFGITGPTWLQSTFWSMPAMIVMKTWKSVGYFTVLFLAGLQNIPQDLHDAARVDGANIRQRIRHITLPLLSPMTLFVIVIAVIGSFQDFDQIFVMTQGGPVNSTNVLVYYLYEQAFQNHRVGVGSAVAVILLLLLIGFTLVQLRLSQRWVHY